jgi:hypothetical protein
LLVSLELFTVYLCVYYFMSLLLGFIDFIR